MNPTPWVHRAVATGAMVTGVALLALSAGGVRSVDAQLRVAERTPVQQEHPTVRDGGTPTAAPGCPLRKKPAPADPTTDRPTREL
ncbi:hypothetical protein [Paraconexibacter sp.]|uniref:hypothetical protein n=1 Tax=Paraconexibacter sp. TaxID=2949640 RepID=UPI00356AEFAF